MGQSPPDFLWAQRTGGSGSDVGYSIAADTNGNVFVTGSFSTTNFLGSSNLISSGLTDIFIAKHSPSGSLLWARQAGGTGYDEGRGIVADNAGNVYVTGHFQDTASFGATNLTSSGQSDVFVAKYDPDGNLVWVRRVGGNDFDEGHAIALDTAGNIYLTGTFDKNATFGSAGTLMNNSGTSDIFVAKVDPLGDFVWALKAGGGEEDNGAGIALDAFGNVYVTGFFAGTATFESTNLTSRGGDTMRDGFLAKYNSNGALIWVQQLGGNNGDEAKAVATDLAGNAVITGSFTLSGLFGTNNLVGNGKDIFIARFDGSGNNLWARQAGGNDAIYGDGGEGISTDPSGNIYATGFFSGMASFGTNVLTTSGFDDAFVSKCDTNGNVIWVRQAGGNLLDAGYGIALAGPERVCVTGFFYGTATFGSTNLISSGFEDLFTMELGMVGTPRISIARNGANITLSWPVWASNFVLEANDHLGSETNDWVFVSTSTNEVTLPLSAQRRLFRLRYP